MKECNKLLIINCYKGSILLILVLFVKKRYYFSFPFHAYTYVLYALDVKTNRRNLIIGGILII